MINDTPTAARPKCAATCTVEVSGWRSAGHPPTNGLAIRPGVPINLRSSDLPNCERL